MDDPVVFHHLQRRQHLHSESSNQARRESHKVVCFHEFVQVQAEKLRHNAEVASEREFLDDLDQIMFVLGILQCKSSKFLFSKLVAKHLPIVPNFPESVPLLEPDDGIASCFG